MEKLIEDLKNQIKDLENQIKEIKRSPYKTTPSGNLTPHGACMVRFLEGRIVSYKYVLNSLVKEVKHND